MRNHPVKLNDGNTMPAIGFGTHKITNEDAPAAVAAALDAGYRLIDTAEGYENERGVGHAIIGSGVPRSELFVTTKLTNSLHGRYLPLAALHESLDELQLDYVDLFLIHWPQPSVDLFVDSWASLCELRREGTAKSIGVSNFNAEHLWRIIDETGEVPAVNQIECHPELQQRELRELHDELEIVTQHWAPLGQNRGLLDLPAVRDIADDFDWTPAQVVLRWALQLGNYGNVPLVKSSDPEHVTENLDVFDFELDDDQMQALAALDCGRRLGPDPVEMNRSNRASR